MTRKQKSANDVWVHRSICNFQKSSFFLNTNIEVFVCIVFDEIWNYKNYRMISYLCIFVLIMGSILWGNGLSICLSFYFCVERILGSKIKCALILFVNRKVLKKCRGKPFMLQCVTLYFSAHLLRLNLSFGKDDLVRLFRYLRITLNRPSVLTITEYIIVTML